MRCARLLVALVAGAVVTSACEDCDRAACDAAEGAADRGGIAQGLAGVACCASDVVGNGCQTCSWERETLTVWAGTAPAATEAEVRAASGREPEAEHEAQGQYALALTPGPKVVCVGDPQDSRACTAVTVHAGEVVTMHLDACQYASEWVIRTLGRERWPDPVYVVESTWVSTDAGGFDPGPQDGSSPQAAPAEPS